MPCSHWSPISLVTHCHPLYPVLIGPPSHWSPNVTLSTLFSLVPHLIGPPMQPWLYSSHWSPSHWSPSLTPSTLFSLVPHLIGPPMRPWLHSSHWSPISLVPQCDHDYTVLIGPPSHWSPKVALVTQFSLVPQCNPYFRWSLISLAPAYNKYLTSRSRLSIWSTHPILSIGSCLEKKVTYTDHDLLHYPGSKI